MEKTRVKKSDKALNKTNTIADLRKKTVEDLRKDLAAAKNDLLEAQKSLKANELANPHAVKKMRRGIAQIKTVMAELSKKPVEEVTNNDKKGAK
jgi:large subunit ribosomal protein L29